jgi:L-fuconolactonase
LDNFTKIVLIKLADDMQQPIIDSHVHVWNLDRAQYSWLKNSSSILNRNFNIEELEKERVEAGVTAGILIQAANNREDTEWMLQVAGLNGWIKGVVGWLPMEDPDSTFQYLSESYGKNPYFKGVRHLIHNETDPSWLLQKEVIKSLSIIAQFHLPYDLVGVVSAHIETALQVAEKVPQLKMIFDHLNQPPIASGEKYGRWGELMKRAAEFPNIYAKISGLGTASGNLVGWKNNDLQPYIEFIVNTFGVERCICGGDWPISLQAGSYSRTWSAYREILASLYTPAIQSLILYDNAKSFYQLG